MYAYVQDVPIREDLYAKIADKLGAEPLAGLIVHTVLKKEDGTLRYVDIWESKAACDAAFAKRIHPAVFAVFREANFRPAGEPRRDEHPVVEVRFGTHRP